MEERSCMTAAKNTLKFHFQVTRGCQSILRAPSTKTWLKSCCVEPSSEIYSGDMKSSAIINQTPCRGGQCLNIATRENSREASTSFTLRPADHHSWMEPHTTGGPQDEVWLYWSHTHCLLGMYSQCDFFDKGKDIYKLCMLFISQHRGQALAFSGSLTSCQRLFPSPPSREPAPRGDPPRYLSAPQHLQVEFFNVKIKIPFFTFCWIIER